MLFKVGAFSAFGKVLCSGHEAEKSRKLEANLTAAELLNVSRNEMVNQPVSRFILWEIIKKHTETGYRIARAKAEFAHPAEDILAHHEHWDGSGYPHGLQGKEISLLARITSVADAYEVMANGRPYKKAMPKEKIIAELKRYAGTQFDPVLVEILLSVLDEETQAKRRGERKKA